jgi:hypothetical protein
MTPEELLLFVAPTVASFIFGIAAGYAKWGKFKNIFSAVRKFVDHIDDSIYDDKVTEDEFRKGWVLGRDIIKKLLS